MNELDPEIDENLSLLTARRDKAQDNERKFFIHPRPKSFTSVNRIAIKINDHELIIIKIGVGLEHSLSIRHEDIFDPLNDGMISNGWDTTTIHIPLS